MPRNAADISLSVHGLGLISGIGGKALSVGREITWAQHVETEAHSNTNAGAVRAARFAKPL
jgi:hypothetical protein